MARKPHSYNYLSHYDHYVPSVADLFILLVWFVVGVLLGNIVTLIVPLVAGDSVPLEYTLLLSYPLMFIPAMIYASVKSRSNSMKSGGLKVDSDNFRPKSGILCAAVAMLATVALSFLCDAVTSAMPPMPEWLEAALDSMTQSTIWVNFICVSIFAPVFEEWLCRGMVMRGLIGKGVKPVWAIVISALFFAVIHANPWQAIPAFLIGCMLGYVYFKTGSLKLTMLMHFTNNTLSLVLSNIESLKDMESWNEVLPVPVYWIVFAACLILAFLSVRFFRSITLQSPGGNFDPVPGLFEQA